MGKKERIAVFILMFIGLASSLYLIANTYIKNTKEISANGGEYTEAMVGQPRFINPILCQTNDIDADLSSLIYSSLLRLDKDGNLKNDLAESYEISEDKLTYTLHIKKNAKWHDGEDLNADDVIYTVKTIQDDSYYSPLIANLRGVRVEKVDDYTINFILKSAYSPFLNALTFGILPQHLWEITGPSEFPLSEFNYQPIGSGPYRLEHFKKDKNGKIVSIELLSDGSYYGQKPYIGKIVFKFYQSEDEAISAFNRKEVKAINYLSPSNMEKVVDIEGKNIYRLSMPRYYAVFFNQTQSKVLADKNVRIALSYATDKNRLTQDVLLGEGNTINTPIPPQLMGYNPDTKTYNYDLENAKKILEDNGWKDTNGDGIREKGDLKLEFNLVSTNWQDIAYTAEILAEMWKEVGANVEVMLTDNIQEDNLQDRSYEAVLFGEILNYDPDPFAFWHSSQKKDPGLNLALYDNAAADKILEEARKETNPEIRAQKYKEFQNIVAEDAPAIFLYSPNYIYIQEKSIKGTELKNIVIPSDRFNNISNWYIKIKRVYK